MKAIKDVKLGDFLSYASTWVLIARKQTLDNKDWYIILALNSRDNVYGVWRTMDEENMLFGKYTPDFIEAVQYFLDHFAMSVRKNRRKA